MKLNSTTIIAKPRITEKAAAQAEHQNVFVFEVHKNATKDGVKKAIKELFNITPLKVNITKLPAKTIMSRGRKGKTPAVVKAYVYLKKEDKIEI